MKFQSADEILDFAIKREEEAREFYTRMAGRADTPWMKRVFEDFAREEAGHREKLLAVRKGRTLEPSAEKVLDLKIADYLVEPEEGPDFDYQQALVSAMKKEKAAFRLYWDLSEGVEDPRLRATLLALAQDEARHKLRFEIEYDQHVLEWN